MKAQGMPPATVITPSMNGGKITVLIDSLSRQTVDLELLVVDNGSRNSEVTRACSEVDFARGLRLERNAGFSEAVNIAAAQAEGDAIVLLNDDSVCEPDFVERMVMALDPTQGVMMAAGVMRDAREPTLIETAGIEIDRALLAFDYLNGEHLSVLDRDPEPPMGPSGAAAAYWKQAFQDTGGFDERIFAYWEDVDLALRMSTRGFRCALARNALGTHAHSATLGSGSPRKNYLMGFGRGYVLRKWSALTPRLIPSILIRDLPICVGQLILDRNAGGIRGRAAGLRAGARREPYPREVVASAPGQRLRGSLYQRARRRRRLRR